jgi:predicted anti-sigma-YlaC factor YlaD
MAEDINCRELTEFIQRYLEDELPTEQKEIFEMHLKLCPPCLHYLNSYKSTVELEKGCADCEESMPEELIRGIAEAMKKSRE